LRHDGETGALAWSTQVTPGGVNITKLAQAADRVLTDICVVFDYENGLVIAGKRCLISLLTSAIGWRAACDADALEK
jgi:hypothetical protein